MACSFLLNISLYKTEVVHTVNEHHTQYNQTNSEDQRIKISVWPNIYTNMILSEI